MFFAVNTYIILHFDRFLLFNTTAWLIFNEKAIERKRILKKNKIKFENYFLQRKKR